MKGRLCPRLEKPGWDRPKGGSCGWSRGGCIRWLWEYDRTMKTIAMNKERDGGCWIIDPKDAFRGDQLGFAVCPSQSAVVAEEEEEEEEEEEARRDTSSCLSLCLQPSSLSLSSCLCGVLRTRGGKYEAATGKTQEDAEADGYGL
ncbi:hypothetical protein MGYG_05958 [Nannizzia gypsea CBS 118893]|uniref:Uncharacterized protein n=1 Tax=Arthroderma gypseum (strain ATCC MYA-4604 / CBS 118893) TaxID=535722 RepID=E4V022_ARTGP|nr:hypothetical protein MGYG_05958 [Nannizzia gypsea CBS 118893]EFR02959.1 hypothetical protein MGYG_05958 [Nannizzia gypsea CBS 118893]